MVVVPRLHLSVHVPLLYHSIPWQLPLPRVPLKGQTIEMEFVEILELPQALVEQCRRNILVVYSEWNSCGVQIVEDGSLGVALGQHCRDVAGGAGGGGGVDEEAVGLGGRRNGGEPPVEDGELRDEGFVDGDHGGVEAGHDGLGGGGGGGGLLGEAVHWWMVGGGVVGTEYLLANGLEGVGWIGVHVVGGVGEEDERGGWVGWRDGVIFRTIDAVDLRVDLFHPTEHMVEGAVLHYQHDDGLDGAR